MKKFFDLSVHQLVDFLLREGDIDDRHFNQTTMSEGSKIHQYYQEKQADNYQSEVALSTIINIDDYTFRLSGRCDGIITKKDEVIIDEIKSFNGDLQSFFSKYELWHLGQAECYAYMYLKNKALNEATIYLTYISQIDKKEEIKVYHYTFSELEEKIKFYLTSYLSFFEIILDLKNKRDESLYSLFFLYPNYRKGQEEMIDTVDEIFRNGGISFIEAPTGIGKTLASIYGTLKNYKDKNYDKIFYVTPKNSGFKIAHETFLKLNFNGLKMKVITISSKEKMCMSQEKRCNPDNCPFTKDYYTKIKDVLKECLLSNDIYDEEYIKKIALKHMVCPFELSLDLSLYCDYIICDYNYVFHPISYFKRYFDELDYSQNYFLLVDEAHNMISRSRDMYSASFDSNEFKQIKRKLSKVVSKDLKSNLTKVNHFLNLLSKIDFIDNEGNEKSELIIQTLDEKFVKDLSKLYQSYKDFINRRTDYKEKDVDDFFYDLYKFNKILDYIDDSYKIFIKKEPLKNKFNYQINLFCLDASKNITNFLEKFKGSVFFSATLSPIDYYEKLIVRKPIDKELILSNPFNEENLNLMINNKISLKLKDRESTLKEVIESIEVFTSNKVGNYLVFAPSFSYLNNLKNHFKNKKDANYLFQKQKMNNKEKDEFLSNFKIRPTKSTIGFVVMGGTFSEGIDLIEDRLIGVIIIGIGLPSFNFENTLLKDYYENSGYDGFEFAYVNVGLNHVMQAVGRLIRTEKDFGSALLIDSRYLYKNYRKLFSNRWTNYKIVNNLIDIQNCLGQFYKN